MVDPLRVQQVEGLLHVLGRPLLTGVRDQVQAVRGGPGVDVGEQARRIADLGRVQPDADELVTEPERFCEGVVGRIGAQVAQEAQDQVGGDAVLAGAVGQRGGEPAEDGLQRHPVAQVRLRVEEDLRPAHAGRRRPGQVGRREVVEVLVGPEHLQVRVVQVEEGLQVVELVAVAKLSGIRGRQGAAVAGREADEELGF